MALHSLTVTSYLQMLSQRLVRASALRHGFSAARRLPTIQRRTFLPSEYTDRKTLDAKYPDPPQMDAAQDPDMVSDECERLGNNAALLRRWRT